MCSGLRTRFSGDLRQSRYSTAVYHTRTIVIGEHRRVGGVPCPVIQDQQTLYRAYGDLGSMHVAWQHLLV